MKRLLLLLLLLAPAASCVHPPPTIVTDQGKNAYTADQLVARLSELQNAVIAASDAHKVKVEDARHLVIWISGDANATPPIVGVLAAIKAAPAGWRGIGLQGWTNEKPLLLTVPDLAPYVPVIDSLLGVN